MADKIVEFFKSVYYWFKVGHHKWRPGTFIIEGDYSGVYCPECGEKTSRYFHHIHMRDVHGRPIE